MKHWWTPPHIQKLFPGLTVAVSLSAFVAIAYRVFWPVAIVMAAALWGIAVGRREFAQFLLLTQGERYRECWNSWHLAVGLPSGIAIMLALADEPFKTVGFLVFCLYVLFHTDRLFRRIDRINADGNNCVTDSRRTLAD